jgi:hypothetical protein
LLVVVELIGDRYSFADSQFEDPGRPVKVPSIEIFVAAPPAIMIVFGLCLTV